MSRERADPEAPDELLMRWAVPLPRGRALDLGAGVGGAAVWLADLGFSVDAVERDPGAIRRLRRLAGKGRFRVHAGDMRDFAFPREEYVLVLALAVLHFLPREELPTLAGRIAESLRPGGLVIARVFVEEAAGEQACASGPAPPRMRDELEFRPLVPGELPELFPALRVEAYEAYRWLAPETRRGYRSGALLVARRPDSGGV